MDDRVKDLVAVQSFNLGKIGTSGLIALRVNFFCGEGGSEAGPDHVLWDGPPLLLRQRYAAGLTLRERSGRWRLRCLGLILARTAAASQGWTERVASSCGDALLERASSVLPERCRPA